MAVVDLGSSAHLSQVVGHVPVWGPVLTSSELGSVTPRENSEDLDSDPSPAGGPGQGAPGLCAALSSSVKSGGVAS